jgi:hypothetical protein
MDVSFRPPYTSSWRGQKRLYVYAFLKVLMNLMLVGSNKILFVDGSHSDLTTAGHHMRM